ANIAPQLQFLLESVPHSHVQDFALGSRGSYYIRYIDPRTGELATELHGDFWPVHLRESPNQIKRVALGADSQYWIANTRHDGNEDINCTIIGTLNETNRQALTCPSGGSDGIALAALGPAGSFVASTQDSSYVLEGLHYELWRLVNVATMKKIGIASISLSPLQNSIWCVVFENGKTKYRLPSAHEATITAHFHPELSLRRIPNVVVTVKIEATQLPLRPSTLNDSLHGPEFSSSSRDPSPHRDNQPSWPNHPKAGLDISRPPFVPGNVQHFVTDRNKAPLIPASAVQVAEIRQLFTRSWLGRGKKKLNISQIYAVNLEPSMMVAYNRYRSSMETAGIERENVERYLFHGTRRFCHIGENPNDLIMCTYEHCHVCMILRQSYKVEKSGTKGNPWPLRWGYGIYCTPASSKADYFSSNGGQVEDSPVKAVLVNTVVLGNPCYIHEDREMMMKPPEEYTSVIGWRPPFGKHDEEYVVYRNDAIRPAYLVIYKAGR
ncbi:hypothetical protein FRB99_000949, partial [Tulasnella sp. 403]